MQTKQGARDHVKQVLTRWPAVKAVAYVADDLRWGIRQRIGRIHSESGSTHLRLSSEESVSYVEEVFNDYRRYGDITHFTGAAADVGPGDNAGVGLLMRAAGCEQVDLVDRFRSRRDPAQQRQIYARLAIDHDIVKYRTGPDWDDSHLEGITWKLGMTAEQFFRQRASQGPMYDLIVSRATLEHLYDPLGAVRDMAACLKPGGRAVHKIDLRDHGMFAPTHHELTFLRFPGTAYRRMTHFSGRPNRVLFDRYRALARDLAPSFEATLLVTSLVGETDEVVPHVPFAELPDSRREQALAYAESARPTFSREFDSVSTEDLAVSGLFFTVTRPST